MRREGENAVKMGRQMLGATNPQDSLPGTIRGDFGMSFSNHLVHGSDSPEASATELALFFAEDGDLVDWTPDQTTWIYSGEELN